MSFKALKFAFVACLAAATSANAAHMTMTPSLGLVRAGTAAQGAGTYDAYDFFLTLGSGPQDLSTSLLNYRMIGTAATGSFADTARQQDDRQTEPSSGDADTAALGPIDTFASTVWRAVGKDTLALGPLSPTVNIGSYSPSGTGAHPHATTPINLIDWSVSDSPTLAGDDNNVADDAVTNDGSVDQQAPYHIARVLAVPGSTGAFEFRIFESDELGVPELFTFTFGAVQQNTAPAVVPELPQNQTMNGQVITADFDAIDAETPGGPFNWNLTLGGFVPLLPGGVNTSDAPTINDADGVFSWDTTGAARGVYTWNITATDGGPGDALTSAPSPFQVTITAVPEPSTLAIFGLAMVGGLGLFRRRNG